MKKAYSIINYFLPGSFRSEEISVICAWLIRLRWVAVCGFSMLAIFIDRVALDLLPIRMIYMGSLIILTYNLVFFLFFHYKKNPTRRTLTFMTHLQVFLDWLALLAIIHISGGIYSPMIFFFILHIIINAMIFPPWQCYGYTTLSLFGMLLLFIYENKYASLPETTTWLGTSFQKADPMSMFCAFAVYTTILFAATFLISSMMARFRQREEDIRRLSERLKSSLGRMETLYEATTAMVSTDDVNQVLDTIVRESAKIFNVKGAILHLVQEGRQELAISASCGLSNSFVHKGPVKRGEGLFPHDSREMIVVEDTSVDPRIVYPQEALNEGIRSIISLPLVHREKVIGDLRLYAENPRRYSKDDISFLKILAGGTAVVINDSRVLHQLKDASRKTVFFANKLSHDLRAPVHAVQSMLAVMDKGYAGDLTEKQKEITSRSIKRLEQLLLLIKNILCLAESRSADNKQQLVPVSLNEIAADSFHLFKVLFEQKKIMTHFDTSPAPIVFKEMAGDFQRLFSNLLENALRYTPKGGRVEMEVTQDAKNISIRISDSGIGIAPEHIEKIFDDFFRSAEARKFVQDGNGLGLPTVKSIVTRYNGFINVESEQAKGTTFFITLPKQD